MKRILLLIAVAALITLGTVSVQAAMRQKKSDRVSDGSCATCTMQGSQTSSGGERTCGRNGRGAKNLAEQTQLRGCGTGDGAGQCKQKRQGCSAGEGNCPGKGQCKQKRQGCGTGEGKCPGKGTCGKTEQTPQE